MGVLVVHVLSPGAGGEPVPDVGALSDPNQHVTVDLRSAVDGLPDGAEVVVAHGRRALAVTIAADDPSVAVVFRPAEGERASRYDSQVARRVRWIAAPDPLTGRAAAVSLGLAPDRISIVADDDKAGWAAVVATVLEDHDEMSHGLRVGPTDRLCLLPVAVRALGPDLLVKAPGPDRDVERLTGAGPALWSAFERHATLAEAAEEVAAAAGVPRDVVDRSVLQFADALIERGLAELER